METPVAGTGEVFLCGEGVDITAKAKELTDGEGGGEVAYDGVGKTTFDASLVSLKPLDSKVLFGGASVQAPPFDIQRLNSSGGIFLSLPSLAWFVRSSEELAKRSSMFFNGIEHGWLNFRASATFPLADAADAHSGA